MRLGPASSSKSIILGFHADKYIKISDIDFKKYTTILSEIGGYIALFYIFALPFMQFSVFNSYQKLTVKLVDQSENAHEFSEETLDLIKQRVSVEGIFTLFDQVNEMKDSHQEELVNVKKANK